MSFKDIFSLPDQLKHIQGVESQLRARRRNGLIATYGTILFGAVQVAWNVVGEEDVSVTDYVQQALASAWAFVQYLGENLGYLARLQFGEMYWAPVDYSIAGFFLIVLGVAFFLLSRFTSFLFKQSEEPFRYTFWIEKFTDAAKDDPKKPDTGVAGDLTHYLHHDLMQMLNRRIGRFSILEEEDAAGDDTAADASLSHIHVDGHFALRDIEEDGKSVAVVEVMPRIRIGPKGNASILTQPVQIPLADASDDTAATLYAEVMEEVYSKLASEIYKQLKIDIENKLDLFPTQYLRATALYYEATDFSRSNTIDSYDYAIELYRKALRYYDISFRALVARIPLLTPFLRVGIGFELMRAKMIVEYGKSLIFRREFSSFTGRTQNPLYEIPIELNRVTRRLALTHNKFHAWKKRLKPVGRSERPDAALEEKRKDVQRDLALWSLAYPADTWVRKHLLRKLDIELFEQCKSVMFDAYVTLALAYVNLGSREDALVGLSYANATYPEERDRNSFYLLTEAEIEVDVDAKIRPLTIATELAPDFEIAQYKLAKYALQRFLFRGEIVEERAQPVIEEFRKVLKINPGNVATYAQMGNLYWLIEDLARAQQHFEKGIKTKAIARQTFVGELTYGLARISARDGDFNKCFDLYTEALAAGPGVGAYGSTSGERFSRAISFFEFISDEVFDRYKRYIGRFEDCVRKFEENGSLSLGAIRVCDIRNPESVLAALRKDEFGLNDIVEAGMRASLIEADGHDLARISENVASFLNILIESPDTTAKILLTGNISDDDNAELCGEARFGSEGAISPSLVNRLMLGKLFSDAIEPYNKDNFCDGIALRSEIVDERGKHVTAGTLKKAYGYILNDFGNACLNYFHRHGDFKRLDLAMRIYERAVCAHPENGIAYYNYENAEMWRLEYQDEQEEILGRVSELTSLERRTDWLRNADRLLKSSLPEVTIRLANTAMKCSEILANDLEKDIAADSGELEGLEIPGADGGADSLFAAEAPDTAGSGTGRKAAALTRDTSKAGEAFLVDKAMDDERLRAEKRQKELVSNIQTNEARLEDARQTIAESFYEGVRRTVQTSGLAAIVEGFGFDDSGSAAAKVSKLDIAPGRITETDINAILGWATLLSTKESDATALEACVQLCKFAERYFPDQFEVYNTFSAAQSKLDKLKVVSDIKSFPATLLLGDEDAEYLETAELPDDGVTGDHRIDRIIRSLSPPHFSPSDIIHASVVLELLANDYRSCIPDGLRDGFAKVCLKFKGARDSDKQAVVAVVRLLNELIGGIRISGRVCERQAMSIPGLAGVASEAIRGNLKGFGLSNFNRYLLEQMCKGAVRPSEMMLYFDLTRNRVKDEWLGADPVHFVSLDRWAPYNLYFLEMQACVREAIRCKPDNSGNLHGLMRRILDYQGYEDDVLENLERLSDEYPSVPLYYIERSRELRSLGKDEETEEREAKFRDARELLEFAIERRDFENLLLYEDELRAALSDQADYYGGVGNFDEAIAICEETAGRLKEAMSGSDPGRIAGYRQELIGVLSKEAGFYADLSKFSEAFRKSEEAREVDPEDLAPTLLRDELRVRQRRSRIVEHYGEDWTKRPPVITPIALEVASDLIPFVEGDQDALQPQLATNVKSMRDGIERRFGVRVPGIRFRGKEAEFHPGQYLIKLSEIEVASGHSPAGKAFVPGSVHLDGYGLKTEEATDPKTGEAGHWVDRDELGRLGDSADRAWADMQYPLRHLEAIIERNLTDFLGIQEVEDLLIRKAFTNSLYFFDNPDELVRLTTLLNGLVTEGLPITDFETIVSVFVRESQNVESLTDLMSEMRMIGQLRQVLPGNQDGFRMLRLGEDVEKVFSDAAYADGNPAILPMPVDDTKKVLDAVRNHASNLLSEVILVDDHRLRPSVGNFLKLEFENVKTLSAAEWLGPADTGEAAPVEIHLDQAQD